MSTWWLSFADPERPKGTQFLGVIVIEAASFEEAILKTWALKLDPGGEVMGYEMDEREQLDEKYHNRLLSAKELEEADIGVSTTKKET